MDGYDLADIALIDSIDMMVDDLEDGERRQFLVKKRGENGMQGKGMLLFFEDSIKFCYLLGADGR